MSTPAESDVEIEAAEIERLFRPSGALLAAGTALGKAIVEMAVARTPYKPATLDLLVRLRMAPGHEMRAVDLGRQLLMSAGYVSRLIDDAEAAGLVGRRPDPDDRRARRITLTADGHAALDEFVPHATRVLRSTVFSVLDDTEAELLVEMLNRVAGSAHDLLDREA